MSLNAPPQELSSTLTSRIIDAFPAGMRDQARLAAEMLADAELSPTAFSVIVNGERVTIPERLYLAAPRTPDPANGVVAALLTRHHDGFVRERAVRRLLEEPQAWPVPFLLRLVGEYVVEIVDRIDNDFRRLDQAAWGGFVAANPDFVKLTDARVASYWNCYYRQISRSDYVGFRLMEKIRRLAAA